MSCITYQDMSLGGSGRAGGEGGGDLWKFLESNENEVQRLAIKVSNVTGKSDLLVEDFEK
jgi:hypothetical protein